MDARKNGFGISPYMQELMSHLDCYIKCEETLAFVKVNPSQVYRVTDFVS